MLLVCDINLQRIHFWTLWAILVTSPLEEQVGQEMSQGREAIPTKWSEIHRKIEQKPAVWRNIAWENLNWNVKYLWNDYSFFFLTKQKLINTWWS